MKNQFKDRTGERFTNNQGSSCSITTYNNNADVIVLFDTGYEVRTRMCELKRGYVKDLLYPSVFGHGYIGIGDFLISKNGKHTEAYIEWKSMLNRCYNPISKDRLPTYVDCYVCDTWLNFQDFAMWFTNQNRPLKWQLDKDILFRGNKVYSPETCRFVPHEINSLFGSHGNDRGLLKQGVCLTKGKYSATISVNSRHKHLGYFNTEMEAYSVYKKAKEENVKQVALKYRGIIDEGIYNSLMNWEL